MLLSVYNSFEDAGEQAAAEAGTVMSMAQDAVLLAPEDREDVIGHLRCYARSVAGPDWEAQADRGGLSPVTDAAADAITESLRRAGADDRNTVAVSAVIADDSDRIQARILRADEGRPTVPGEVWALMLVTVAIMVGGLAAFGHPAVRPGVQLAVLIGTTAVFGLTLLVVHDLDRPYDGSASIEPTAILTVERRMSALPGGDAEPPCDADGRLD